MGHLSQHHALTPGREKVSLGHVGEGGEPLIEGLNIAVSDGCSIGGRFSAANGPPNAIPSPNPRWKGRKHSTTVNGQS